MVFIASDNVTNASKISGSSACLFPTLSLIILFTSLPYFVEAPTSIFFRTISTLRMYSPVGARIVSPALTTPD